MSLFTRSTESGECGAGQTFYFSWTIEEDLDSPTLCLDGANHTFSVFLDGTLVYTDCPEQDNRIGYLRLPELEWDRLEAVLVKLPLDCTGKTDPDRCPVHGPGL